jgi:hypothetical protein
MEKELSTYVFQDIGITCVSEKPIMQELWIFSVVDEEGCTMLSILSYSPN